MTVRVDMSQAPARVTVTASIGDLCEGRVPRFLLEFGGDGRADVVIEPSASLEVATRLRASVLVMLLEAEAMAGGQQRILLTGRTIALPKCEPVRALLRAV